MQIAGPIALTVHHCIKITVCCPCMPAKRDWRTDTRFPSGLPLTDTVQVPMPIIDKLTLSRSASSYY